MIISNIPQLTLSDIVIDQQIHLDPYMNNLHVDVLIVGAGFAGIYLLHNLRQRGYNVKIFEAANDLGGTWRVNCYPGARVDSYVPIVYELSIPEVWKSWTWSELYPSWQEMRQYFEHCDKVLEIRKDVAFNTKVTAASFDTVEGKWNIRTEDGRTCQAKYFILCVGFASKNYIPDFPGLDTFKGVIHHSAEWPENHVNVAGKRCAVIGTGASGVQIIQEWAKKAKSLVVFQRTPNMCLPVEQRKLAAEEQNNCKNGYHDLFLRRTTYFSGSPYHPLPYNTFDHTPEEREHVFESIWEKGGLAFWVVYLDALSDLEANREAYNFWAKKVRARIQDPRKRDLLAPLEPPHPYGIKRPSLEQDYFEMFNKPNVDIVPIKQNPIVKIEPEGIVTSDGKLHEIDILALATGFDAITGGLLKIDLTDINGQKLNDKWSNGTKTYQGISIAGYPNMFFTYGPQAPTAFAIGPTLAEIQGDWIAKVIDRCEENDVKFIVADEEAQEKWANEIHEMSDKTLFPLADSWYMGANIPGKKKEMLNFIGGLPKYVETLEKSFNNNLEGYILVKN